MGVIVRQGIKQSIVSYAGILIGAVSTLFLYPLVRDEYGLVQFVMTAALLVVPFVMFGMTSVIIRFYPEFEDEKSGHHGLLALSTLAVVVGFALFLLFLFFFEKAATDYYADKPAWYREYLPFAVPLVLLISYSNLLKHYTHNFKRIVFPSVFDNLLPKIVLPMLLILLWQGFIGLRFTVCSMLVLWVVIVVAQLAYIRHLGQLYFKFDFAHLTRERAKRMVSFGAYGLFGGWGYVLISRVDIYMVGLITESTEAVTIYTFGVFVCEFIDVPRKAIGQISSPLISKAWNEKDLPYLTDLYQKSSLVQYIAGLGLLLLIWLNVNDIYSLMHAGEVYRKEVLVVLFLGLSKVVDMVTGVNGAIIAMSKHYKINLIFLMLMAGINIGLNNWLIPLHGLPGAALATLISLVLFNLLKFLFLFFKFKMQPFTLRTLTTTGLALSVWFVVSSVPFSGIILLDLVLRTLLCAGLFAALIYVFKVSAEVNEFLDNLIKKVMLRS